MRKSGVYSIKDAVSNRKFSKMIDLFKYDRNKTFTEYDNISFKEFAEEINLPAEMRLMFTTFSRAFFAEPQYISMAELIKSFHFYFLSNDKGLIYDVLNDDFQTTLLNPAKEFIINNGGKIFLSNPVHSVRKINNKFILNDEEFDYLIVATDIPGTKKIFSNSDFLKYEKPEFYNQIMTQKKSQRYAVLRLWMDKRIGDDLPFFVFTDAFEILDSVTFYHNMEKESAEWASKNNGGIYELHSYALPDYFEEINVRDQFIEEFFAYFPELKSSKILYENLQIKKDFTAFHTGLYKQRPEPVTQIENLYLAADWIKLHVPSMLMEASATSAIYSVNDICRKENIKGESVYSVPLKGLLA
jgi:isorenieratene synthase